MNMVEHIVGWVGKSFGLLTIVCVYVFPVRNVMSNLPIALLHNDLIYWKAIFMFQIYMKLLVETILTALWYPLGMSDIFYALYVAHDFNLYAILVTMYIVWMVLIVWSM